MNPVSLLNSYIFTCSSAEQATISKENLVTADVLIGPLKWARHQRVSVFTDQVRRASREQTLAYFLWIATLPVRVWRCRWKVGLWKGITINNCNSSLQKPLSSTFLRSVRSSTTTINRAVCFFQPSRATLFQERYLSAASSSSLYYLKDTSDISVINSRLMSKLVQAPIPEEITPNLRPKNIRSSFTEKLNLNFIFIPGNYWGFILYLYGKTRHQITLKWLCEFQ